MSYRGIGRPINYSAARSCAWTERAAQRANLGQNLKQPTAWVVGGSLILADLYANGAGVQRNLPLAMRFLCEADSQTAELALEELAKKPVSKAGAPIEFCDYAATTFEMNFCQDYESEVADDRRSRFYKSVRAKMSPAQQVAFDQLLAEKTKYIDTHAYEVDQGGTIHNIRTLGSEEILEDRFRIDLVHFERGQWPSITAGQVNSADAMARGEYRKKFAELSTQTPEPGEEGASVTATSLAEVEAAWTKYREAWIAFAKLRYPAEATTIAAEISLERYRLLKTIEM